jgi:hypothetical protein
MKFQLMKSIHTKNLLLIGLFAIFILGIFCCLHPLSNTENMMNMIQGNESMETVHSPDSACPDVLVRSGNALHLLNTKQPRGPLNPLVFESLDKYMEYVQTQRTRGIRCPVLFLQEESNAQGQTVYRMRPGPTHMNPGVPTAPIEFTDGNRDRPPFNDNQFAGFDPYGQHIGQYTELDQIHDSTQKEKISDNPMDTNWGGVLFSQHSVDSGKYADREVGKVRMVPKVVELYK